MSSCATVVEQRVESTVAKALPCALGPADRYDVQVSGSSVDASRIDRVDVKGYRVARPGAPVVDSIGLTLQDVRVDRTRNALAAVGRADVNLRLRQQDVASFLERPGRFEQVSVVFYPPNGVVIGGRPRVAGIALPAAVALEVRGRIVARSEQLRIELDDMRAVGFSAPALWRGLVQLAINPLIDSDAFPIPAHFDTVDMVGQELIITASGAGESLRRGDAVSRRGDESSCAAP